MNVIFLDFDGVLVTGRYDRELSSRDELYGSRDNYGFKFDPLTVDNLRRLCYDFSAKIVIISDWGAYNADSMYELWNDRNMPSEIIDVFTHDVLTGYPRGFKIKHWLENTEHDIDSYLILDDVVSDLRELHPNNFVECNLNEGINREVYELSRIVLSSKPLAV